MSYPYLGDFTAGATVRGFINTFDVLTWSADPIVVGELRIYKNADPNQLYPLTPAVILDTFDSMRGVALWAIDTSANATFFAVGNDYIVVRSHQTVGEAERNVVVAQFSIENRGVAKYQDIINYLESGTFTDALELASATASAALGLDAIDIAAIDGNTAAAVNLRRGATSFVFFTVDSGSFTPTTTQFETDLTEATADHYKDMRVIWLTGALAKGNPRNIDAYTLAAGKGHFTVAAMTEAPANGDTGILVP